MSLPRYIAPILTNINKIFSKKEEEYISINLDKDFPIDIKILKSKKAKIKFPR